MKTTTQQIEVRKIHTLRLAARRLLLGASTQDSLWISIVHVMLKNLELLGEHEGEVGHLTDLYQSKIKAHPGTSQNRGEKPYRVRLSQFLTSLRGGQT